MGMRKQLLPAIAWLCLLASSSADHCGRESFENKILDFKKITTDATIIITELQTVTLLVEDEDAINQCIHACCDFDNDACNFATYDPAIADGPNCRLYSCHPERECTVIDKAGSILIVNNPSTTGEATGSTDVPSTTTVKTNAEPNATSTVQSDDVTVTNAADDNGIAGDAATPPAMEQTQDATEGTETTDDATTTNSVTEDVVTKQSTETQDATEKTETTVDSATAGTETNGVSTNPSTETNTTPGKVPETTLAEGTIGASTESAQTADNGSPTTANAPAETTSAEASSTKVATDTTENSIDNAETVTESGGQNVSDQAATTTNKDTNVTPSPAVTEEVQQTASVTAKTEATATTEGTTLVPVEASETEETPLDQTTDAETRPTSVETSEMTEEPISTEDEEMLTTTPIITDYDAYDSNSNDTDTTFAQKTGSLAMSSALIAALSFGILFCIAVGIVIVKLCHSSWQRRHYSRIDYLVNGMYN